MSKFHIMVDNKVYEVEIEQIAKETKSIISSSEPTFDKAKKRTSTSSKKEYTSLSITQEKQESLASNDGTGIRIEAPMPGTILDIRVKVGDTVYTGQVLAILEAMKMENDITAPQDGIVKEVKIKKGTTVNSGDALFILS